MRTETAAPTKEKHMETTENVLNAFTFDGTSIATVTDEDQNIWGALMKYVRYWVM